jgi:ABC-type hemin transport system ATPase subunit
LISHDFKLIHHYVQRVLLLEDGRIKQAGNVQQDGGTQTVANEQEYGLGGYVNEV